MQELISQQTFAKASLGQVEKYLKMLKYAGAVLCANLESSELTTQGLYLRGEPEARNQLEPSVERILRG